MTKLGIPQGHMGIGLCHICTTAHKADPKANPFPSFAVTQQPIMVPVPGGSVVLAVPVCYEHVAAATQEQHQAQTRRPLLVAGGMP